jgi:mRNA-degrading endonuclease toxin of MazEF toxin-antitoxin module
VVIVAFPYVGGGPSKNRPAVVIQCDRLNGKLQNTVVAMITGNTRLVGKEPTQFLIDPTTADGQSSGLNHRL